MKKLLLVVAILVVVAGALMAFVVYSANSLVARFKPDIEKSASDALHASVTFGDISASVFPSVQLKVAEARVAAQPGSAEALALKGLVLHVRLLPLLSGRLVIETVALDHPTVTVLKTKEGMFLEGLPRRHDGPAAAPRPVSPRPVEVLAAPAAALNIDLRTFQINDATLTMRNVEQHSEVVLRKINVAAAISVVGDTVTVSRLTGRADLPGTHRISVSGTSQTLNLTTGQLELGNLQASVPGGELALAGTANVQTGSGVVTLSSDGIKLDEVAPLAAAFTASAADVALRGTVQPNLKATFGSDAYSAAGNLALQDVTFQRGTLSVSGMSGPLMLAADGAMQTLRADGLALVFNGKPGKLSFSAVVEGDSVRIDPLALSALSGSLSGDVETSLSPPHRFAARLEGSGFSVGEVMALAKPREPVRLEGVVSKLVSYTRGQWQGDVTHSLDGTATLGIQHGVIKGINLAAVVLKAAGRIPLLAGVADTPGYERHLSSKDTVITSLTGDFTINSGWAETRNLTVVSELFTLTGSGRASFASDLDLDATLTFNRELSQAMTARAKELRAVLAADGTLSVPLKVDGRPPHVAVRPDLERLIVGSSKNVLEGPVGKALGKALNGEKTGDKLLDRLLGR